ncbi:MAG: arylsulfatase [Phycisphaerae bacterium]|nr:arylsulfatase [Phycisphaerae bacterium]
MATMVGLTGLPWTVSVSGTAAPLNKPNILFIFSDDLSYRDLSCYGQTHYVTPNLDTLAMSGLRFTNAYAGSPECAPSRASLMTGMHMGHCRIRANRSVRGQDHLLAGDVTMAEVLKQAGYATGFIGKWGIGLPGTEGTPDKQGFDFSYGYYDQLRAHGFYPHYLMRNGNPEALPENYGFDMDFAYKHNSDKRGQYNNVYDENGRLVPRGVKDPAKAQYSEDLFQKEALGFIRTHKDTPFFLYYATQLPHGPCITPDLGRFKDRPWDQKHKEWAAMVEHMDRSVGHMVSQLEACGILDNTIIFFAGDNGYSQWGYFARPAHEDDPVFKNKGPWPKGKFTCTHEGGMRVPFFAYWKGKIEAQENDHVCALYDMLATTADLAGVSPPTTDGISLVPTLLGRPDEQRTHAYLYWENGTQSSHAQSVRMDRWWAFRPHPDRPIALYDITRDINCEQDLATEHPEIVARIKQIFTDAHTDSPWYVNPGETRIQIDAKQQNAQRSGQMQDPVKANTLYKGRSDEE